MPTKILDVVLNEKGTGVVVASFSDETGSTVVPSLVTWSLTDSEGNIINDRKDVVVGISSSVTIVLYGDDLKVLPNDNYERKLTISAVYSSSLGDDLPLNDELTFYINDLVNIV